MGWAGGSDIAEPIIRVVKKQLWDNNRRRRAIYEVMLAAMVSHDWDTVDEVLGIDPEFDKVAKKHLAFDEEDG